MRGFMTKDGVIWVAAVMRNFATDYGNHEITGGAVKEGKRWRDH